MSDSTETAELLAGVALAIAAIMEDEIDRAVSMFPQEDSERGELFDRLAIAGRDIAVLAGAACVIIRRSS